MVKFFKNLTHTFQYTSSMKNPFNSKKIRRIYNLEKITGALEYASNYLRRHFLTTKKKVALFCNFI